MTCLRHNLWGSNNSHLKNWYIGDYIVFIVNREIVALAKVDGEQFRSEELIWNNGDYPFRLPITFVKVLSYSNRQPVHGEIKELLKDDWQNYGIPIRNKLLLSNESSERLLHLISQFPDSTYDVLYNNENFSAPNKGDALEFDSNTSDNKSDIDIFEKLNIYKWKQFENVEIKFHKRMTILTGANGSGKTTLLNLLNKHFGWEYKSISTPEKNIRTSKIKYTSGYWGSMRRKIPL